MKNLMKMVLAVFAVGLVLGGSAAMALAQSAQGMGSSTPRYPSDDSWTGATKPGSMSNYQGGGYTSYPPDPDYANATKSNGWIHMGNQADHTVTGTITELDFAKGTLTLNDGEQFTLPRNLEYTSLPMLGEAVEVTFAERNGQNVALQVDPDDTARSSHSSDSSGSSGS